MSDGRKTTNERIAKIENWGLNRQFRIHGPELEFGGSLFEFRSPVSLFSSDEGKYLIYIWSQTMWKNSLKMHHFYHFNDNCMCFPLIQPKTRRLEKWKRQRKREKRKWKKVWRRRNKEEEKIENIPSKTHNFPQYLIWFLNTNGNNNHSW